MPGFPKSTEAIVQRSPLRIVFLKFLQNSQENTCTRVFFLMLQASTLSKKRLCHGCLTFFEAHLFRVKLPTNINVHNKIHGNLYGIAVFAGQKICRISSLFRFVEALSKCRSLVTDASKYLS